METETERRIFEKLDDISDRLARVETTTAALSEGVRTLQVDVRKLDSIGCARGQDHDHRIDKLEARPERLLAAISVIVSILAGLAAVAAVFTR